MILKVSNEKSSEKPPLDNDANIVTQTTPANNEQPKKSAGRTKKFVLGLVFAVVLVGLVIAGVLITFRLVTDSQNEVLKFTRAYKDRSNNNNVNQSVSVDTDNNIVVHRAVQNGIKATILQDFARSLQISRVESSLDTTLCYVSVLNQSMALNILQVGSEAPPENLTAAVPHTLYKTMSIPIPDKRFLGERANQLCADFPTYWEVQQCEGDGGLMKSRQKRDAACGGILSRQICICLPCFWRWCCTRRCWCVGIFG